MFRNVKELIEITQEKQIPISEVMITQEMEVTQKHGKKSFKEWSAISPSWKQLLKKG